MMGPRQEAQAALFYEFSLEDHVPQNHLIRSIDLHLNLVPCQGFWDRWRRELREVLAHLVHVIMRRICGEASA
uniref:hypothetical protein n=1 Tax=Ruegeria atlantica TaxID=81569 RepID=UPI001C2BCA37